MKPGNRWNLLSQGANSSKTTSRVVLGDEDG